MVSVVCLQFFVIIGKVCMFGLGFLPLAQKRSNGFVWGAALLFAAVCLSEEAASRVEADMRSARGSPPSASASPVDWGGAARVAVPGMLTAAGAVKTPPEDTDLLLPSGLPLIA